MKRWLNLINTQLSDGPSDSGVEALFSVANLVDTQINRGSGSNTFTRGSSAVNPETYATVGNNVPVLTSKGVVSELAGTNKCTCYGVPRADSLGAELLTTAQAQCDSGWTSTGESSQGSGAINLVSTGGASTLTGSSVLTINKQYRVTFTVSGTPSGKLRLNNTTFSYTPVSGTNVIDYMANATFTGFVAIGVCNVVITDCSWKEVSDPLLITSKYYSETASFSQNIPNMTLSGDTAAVLSIVTDQTALEAAGLVGITNGYKVYDFVNNSSSATTFVGIDGLGNTNMQTSSLIARRLTGTGSTSFIGVAGNSDALITSSNYTRISGSRATVAGLLRIYCGPNSSIRFILPQLEESSVSTTPMPTAGATATRAATVNSYPTSGNLPASGVRHISLVWTPQDVTAGKVQYLWSSYVSAGNYTAIWSNSVIVCLEKAVAGVSEYVTFPITPAIGTAMLIEGYIYANNTLGLAVNGVLQSGTLGSELITVAADRDFSSDTGFWTKNAGWSIGGGVAAFAVGASTLSRAIVSPHVFYRTQYDLKSISGASATIQPLLGADGSGATTAVATDNIVNIIKCTSGTTYRFSPSANAIGTIDNVSIKEVYNNSTTVAPQIGTNMELGSLNGASQANANFGTFKILTV